MYDSICVPTDGSDAALAAGEHAVELARQLDATLHVVSVVDLETAAGPFSAGGLSEEDVERLEAEQADAVRAIEERAGSVRTRTAILEGRPGQEICEYADEHDVDLIAMGTHGRTGIDRLLTGSVTEHVVRHAGRPVVTVRDDDDAVAPAAYDDVLVPTDGSETARAAAEHAIALARETGARLHAVTVVDRGALPVGTDVGTAAETEEVQSRGEDALEPLVERATDAGVDVETAVREGYPAESLLEYAADADVDLVAMGTHGRTGAERVLAGSTTERVIRRADVPVLSVPEDA